MKGVPRTGGWKTQAPFEWIGDVNSNNQSVFQCIRLKTERQFKL
jgi:hypothetical protein